MRGGSGRMRGGLGRIIEALHNNNIALVHS